MNKPSLPKLTVALLQVEAGRFALAESEHYEKSLYGATDGKAIGTYLEHKFQAHLSACYAYTQGNSAKGIDFPALEVDMKVTSINQPQSSCPFKDARQKIYGLGYSLLVFVYNKKDNAKRKAAQLNIRHTIFVEKARTGDYQMTSGLLALLKNNANLDDIMAFFEDRSLPVDDITRKALAAEVLECPPALGYLTISNALQWRLQYTRAIEQAGAVGGLLRIV